LRFAGAVDGEVEALVEVCKEFEGWVGKLGEERGVVL